MQNYERIVNLNAESMFSLKGDKRNLGAYFQSKSEEALFSLESLEFFPQISDSQSLNIHKIEKGRFGDYMRVGY